MQDPDQQLISKAKEGNQDGYAKLVKKYYEMVFTVAYGVLNRREDAQDAAQEVFLKVFNQINNFEEKSKFKTWLYRIAVNDAIDIARRRKPMEPEEKINTVAASLPKPDAKVLQDETNEMVRSALDSLSPEHRAILVLREWDDLSYEEIASMLNLDLGTVMSRIFYARKSLGKILTPNFGKRS